MFHAKYSRKCLNFVTSPGAYLSADGTESSVSSETGNLLPTAVNGTNLGNPRIGINGSAFYHRIGMDEWNEYMDEWIEYMDEWIEYMDEWNEYMDEWNEYMDEWIEYMDEWNEYMDEWNEYMDEWNEYMD